MIVNKIFLLVIWKSFCNYFDKERYVPHYQNLQLYLWLGLKLKKIIMYKNWPKQSQWPKPQKGIKPEKIDDNILKRCTS